MPDRARIKFDHPQRRMKTNFSAIAIRGSDWVSDLYSNAFTDLTTGTGMQRPMCFFDAYWTSNAGIYAKPTCTTSNSALVGVGLEVTTAAKWTSADKLNAGFKTHYYCNDTSGEYIRTSTTVGKNRGVFFSGFLYDAGDHPLGYEVGWSNSVTPSATGASVGAEIYADGRVVIYKGGVLVGSGNVTPSENGQLNILFLPFRKRDMLVLGQDRRGFTVTFEDIDEDVDVTDPSYEITPDEKFFCVAGTGGAIVALIHPAKFNTSGYLVSKAFKMIRPPKLSQTLATWTNPVFTTITAASLYGDKSYSGGVDTVDGLTLKQGDGTTTFVNDGVETECRVRADFSCDGNYTSFLYGATLLYDAEFADCDGSEEFDATPYISKKDEIQWCVPDDGFGQMLRATLMDPETIEETVPDLRVTSYRPVSFQFATLGVLDGYMKRPRFQDGVVAEVKRTQFEVCQIEKLLELYIFQTRVPFDGWELCQQDGDSAVRFVLELVVDGTYLQLSDLVYRISEVPDGDGTTWNVAAEVGETGMEVFEKLHRLCSDCVYGVHPGADGPEFWFKTPEDLPQEPCITLYRTKEDAQLADPLLTDEEAMDLCYDQWYEEPLEIEANDIQATGIDPRSGDILAAYVVDEASQDPTLPPSSRPENWTGFPLCLGVAARSIRTIGDAERVVEKLAPLATEVKKIGEFDGNTVLLYEDEVSGVMLPVSRFDLINLDGIGERRVTSMDARFMVEEDIDEVADPLIVRRAHYCVGTIIGRGGMTVAQIQANSRMRLAQRGVRQLTPGLGAGLVSGFYAVSRVTP